MNVIHSALGCGQYSKFDQVQLERLVESWLEKSKSFLDFKKCNIFYRKCSVDDANISNQSTELKGKCSTKRKVTFVSSDSEDIIVHQEWWQRRLLIRYGDICLLDATQKTTKYTLPFFALCSIQLWIHPSS